MTQSLPQNLSIDLTDPRVQRMLRSDHPVDAGASGKRPVVQLAGDVPDPSAITHQRGLMSHTSLCSDREEVVVVYRGIFLTVDIYRIAGEPMKAHLLCPRCRKHLTVSGDRKAIAYDAMIPNPMRAAILATGAPELVRLAATGRLSIEAFECPWETGDATHVRGGVHTGASLCRLRIAIEDNRVMDA